MTVAYCLGFDPGVHTGWALLERLDSRRPTFVDGGVIEGPDGAEAAIADRLRATVAIVGHGVKVGVETIRGYTHARGDRGAKAMTKHLNATSELAGVIAGMAMGMTLRVGRVPATTWRKMLCGSGTASDATVKAAMGVLGGDLPVRTSVHLRDAAGVAFFVLGSTTTGVVVSAGSAR